MRRYLVYSVIVIASFAVALYFKPSRPLEFDSVSDAKERIERAGFQCVSFHADIAQLVVVTCKDISDDDAFEFQSRHVAIDNTGKVLLMKVKGDYDVRPLNWRTWGQVSATGDPALLDKIESTMKSE